MLTYQDLCLARVVPFFKYSLLMYVCRFLILPLCVVVGGHLANKELSEQHDVRVGGSMSLVPPSFASSFVFLVSDDQGVGSNFFVLLFFVWSMNWWTMAAISNMSNGGVEWRGVGYGCMFRYILFRLFIYMCVCVCVVLMAS